MEIEIPQNYRSLCETAQTLFVENFEGKLSEAEILTKLAEEFGYTEQQSQDCLRSLRNANILLVAKGKKDVYKLQNNLVREALANCT